MHGKIDLLVFVALWQRPKITELCFKGLNRLKQHPDFNIQVLAVVSEEEMIPLCEKYGVNYVIHENLPLGRKKNFGISAARQYKFDYLLEIGSDTLILNELLDDYKQYIGVYDFFGICDCAFIDSETGSCRRVGGASTYGGGRMIAREILEKMDWKLWRDDVNRGMDNNSILRMQSAGIGYRQVKSGEFPMVFDIKSPVNIWPFNHLVGQAYDKDVIIGKLSIEEQEFLKEIMDECQTQQTISESFEN
jgi:hypothetical protein